MALPEHNLLGSLVGRLYISYGSIHMATHIYSAFDFWFLSCMLYWGLAAFYHFSLPLFPQPPLRYLKALQGRDLTFP